MLPLYLLTPIRRTAGILINFLKHRLVLRVVTRGNAWVFQKRYGKGALSWGRFFKIKGNN